MRSARTRVGNLRFGAALIAVTVLVATATATAPTASSAETRGFAPLESPRRLADTRPGHPTIDGQLTGVGAVVAGTVLEIPVRGRAGINADAAVAAVNLAVADASGPGFLTLFPCDVERPVAANLNYSARATVSALAMSRISGDGTICVYAYATTHVVVDVTGTFPQGDVMTLPAARRLLDTRAGYPTADGAFAGEGVRAARSTTRLTVAGRVELPEQVGTVVLNVAVDRAAEAGFVTVHACDEPRPNASALNYRADQTVANAAITRVGADGDVCLYAFGATDLIVDVTGWIEPGAIEMLEVPQRMLDTRAAMPTVDGAHSGGGIARSYSTLRLTVAGRGGIPAGAGAIVANLTAVSPTAAGFVTLHPGGTARPTAANLNHANGATTGNAVIAALGSAGDLCIYTSRRTHLVVDVVGWLPGPAPAAASGCVSEPLAGLLPAPGDLARPPTDQIGAVPLALEPVLDMSHLTGMTWNVREGAYFAITQDGYVHRIPADLSGSEVVLDLSGEVTELLRGSERGLLGIAFDPSDGRMFLHFTDRGNDTHIVSFAMRDRRPDPSTRRHVLFLEQPGLGHNGGAIHFDEQAELYVALGDGGGSNGRDAQDGSVLHGSILKIIPNGGGDGYEVPADNPFVGEPTRRDELWAMGLRNPWQFSIDPASGDIWIGDVGERTVEELNVVPAGTSGHNFGWYWFEGTRFRGVGVPQPGLVLTPPVYEYGRDVGASIIAGRVYHGSAIPELRGAFVFADLTGPFFGYGAEGGTRLSIDAAGPITAFAETPDRELLVLTLTRGLFRLVRA